MLRFVGQRLLFIALIYVLIVFLAHLGMRMIRNSEVSNPSYDLVQHTRSAWAATRRANTPSRTSSTSGSLRCSAGVM